MSNKLNNLKRNKMNQTAVEWFQDQIIKIVNGTCELSEIQIFEQAKEIEKNQMENVWHDSRVEDFGNDYIGKKKSFNDYYNETYKQPNQ